MSLIELEYKELENKVLAKISRDLENAYRAQILEDYLRSIKCNEFIEKHNTSYVKNAKIIIIGDSAISIKEIEAVAKNNGINPNRLELHLDYKKNKHFNIKKLEWNCEYSDIIFGPTAHKMVGIDDNSSAIAMIKHNPEAYPKLNIANDSNSLKITKKSLEICLKNTQYYLDNNS